RLDFPKRKALPRTTLLRYRCAAGALRLRGTGPTEGLNTRNAHRMRHPVRLPCRRAELYRDPTTETGVVPRHSGVSGAREASPPAGHLVRRSPSRQVDGQAEALAQRVLHDDRRTALERVHDERVVPEQDHLHAPRLTRRVMGRQYHKGGILPDLLPSASTTPPVAP